MIFEALNKVDWNFPGAGSDGDAVQSSHWFPGNFIGQIPSTLIQTLSVPGALVLDPFSGSGTTAVEALRLDRRVIASDCVMPCVLITAGKVALQKGALRRALVAELLEKLVWRNLCVRDDVGLHGEGSDPELSSWYGASTLAQLRFLWGLVEEQSKLERDALALIFSDTLFACASPGLAVTATGNRRRHHWGWIADNVKPRSLKDHDAIGAFEERLLRASGTSLNRVGGDAAVLCQDARALAQVADSVDLVVTSPPYVSMIDYTRANRLLYTWMGWEFDNSREVEIGARFKRKRQSVVADYLADMKLCWTELHRVMKPGAFCALVIGESRRYPGTVVQTLSDLEALMPCVWGPVNRTPSRRRVSDRFSNPPLETLYVFQKK